VLLVALVLLVVLATLGYTLTSEVSAYKRRAQYMMSYQAARYGCDSGLRYALTIVERFKPKLVSDVNMPDFSDLFRLSDAEYEELLARVAAQRNAGGAKTFDFGGDANDINDVNAVRRPPGVGDSNLHRDINDVNKLNDLNDLNYYMDSNDVHSLFVPGPYGEAWPLVSKPVELEIGTAKVKIEIEDENAKYPAGWLLMNEKEVSREVEAGFRTFCNWMEVNEVDVDYIKEQFRAVTDIRPFKIDFQPISKLSPVGGPGPSLGKSDRSKSRTSRERYATTSISQTEQMASQAKDFSVLLSSSLIDRDFMAKALPVSEKKKESVLKYISLWGTTKVNINTSPRHVLEAAFMFGGDADKIADAIIALRRVKPIEKIDDLKRDLLRYTVSIEKCEKYITTVSDFFTVRVTATSGVAQASAVIALTKWGPVVRTVAVVPGG
jgi:hypothetical protein